MRTLITLLLLSILSGCAAGRQLVVPDAGNLAIKYAALKYGARYPEEIAENIRRFDQLISRVDNGEMVSAAAFRDGVLKAVDFDSLDAADRLLVYETMSAVELALDKKLLDGSLPLQRLIGARNALEIFRQTLAATSRYVEVPAP